jgi:dTDP-glucose pyrophosphorylase
MGHNIVITMAGKGSRFIKAGYNEPKYMIKAHNKTLFYWALKSLKNFLSGNVRLIFITLRENNARKFIESECADLGIKNIYIYELDHVTDGQATSAFNSSSLWEAEKSLLIYNIDTYINPRSLKISDIPLNSDGWIPCFKAKGNHWSFVSLDEHGWAQSVSEKKRISEFASIGLYWFKNADDFLNAYDNFFIKHKNEINGERYIAPLYNYLISNNKNISIANIPIEDVYPI